MSPVVLLIEPHGGQRAIYLFFMAVDKALKIAILIRGPGIRSDYLGRASVSKSPLRFERRIQLHFARNKSLGNDTKTDIA
jgi:hypothetical protein